MREQKTFKKGFDTHGAAYCIYEAGISHRWGRTHLSGVVARAIWAGRGRYWYVPRVGDVKGYWFIWC
jgi:hypothetical protein